MQTIDNILRETGPCLSSEVVKRLVADGVAPAAARKRVSRANGSVQRIQEIQFPNREKFLFLGGQKIEGDFRHKLADALINSGSCYGRALVGLKSRGGAILASHFPVASGLPVEKAKGHVLHSFAEQKLLELRLVENIVSADGNLVSMWDDRGMSARRRAAIAVEEIVLSVLRIWLIKIGWSSTNTLKIRQRENTARFGQFAWDLVGPSYLAGLVNFREKQIVEGFIVGDILLDRLITTTDLLPFFAKWDSLTAQKRATRLQPIFVGDFFADDALASLRKRGCFIAIPATIFGIEAARGLRDLIGTIENAAKAVMENPDAVFDLISKLSKIEGAALNLRGVVIELMVARLFTLDGYLIDVRQIVRAEGRQAEIDIKARKSNEVVCCECKGKSPNALVDAPEIKEWVDESLPVIKNWLKHSETLPDTRRFEFYSSTDNTPAAQELILELKLNHKKFPLEFFKGADLLKKLRDAGQNSLVDIFREQFSPK
jgi:hypothetical protein